MKIRIRAEPLSLRKGRRLGRTPRDHKLSAELTRRHTQRTQYERVFRRRRRGKNVAIDPAGWTGRHHDGDRSPVELVVAADDDAVDVFNGQPSVGERGLRDVVDHLLERTVATRDR